MFPHVTHYALRASYVFPVDSPPLAGGVVVIDNGRITRVSAELPPCGCKLYDLGNVALLPGLVNAHIHLDFSHLPVPLGRPGIAFADWLETVVLQRRENLAAETTDTKRLAVSGGLRESLERGTTTLGNISREENPHEKNSRGLDCVSFLELIGLSAERADAQRQRMVNWLLVAARHAGSMASGWQAGISPHAPYTSRRELIAAACEASRKFHVPLAMHLAESPEELQLLDSQNGPLVDVLTGLDAWDASAFERGLRPLDYLQLLAGAERALVIHGNYLDAGEQAWLARHSARMAVIYCPRTHHHFGHSRYPLAELLAAGATVALGTDGRGTNPDLSLLAEMRHAAHVHSEVSPSEIVRLGTLGGALALGCADRVGSLKPGKDANLVAVRLPDRVNSDPHALLLDSDTETMLTIYRGRLVFPRVSRIEELELQQ